MPITQYSYFYDAQMRRFLEQIVRAFSGFQYRTGRRANEEPQLIQVPCRMASTNRMVSSIMQNGSENVLLSVPLITVWQTGLSFSMDRLQNPGHVDTRQVWERSIDLNTGNYTENGGVRYSVERLMPRPFEMAVQVDIWTSNIDQKHQLLEQILTVITPTFDIQNSENPLDWSAMTMVMLEDIQLSSRSIPVGTQDEIDIATVGLKIPIWLSPPAKVLQQKRIEQIVANIRHGDEDMEDITTNEIFSQQIITPGNHHVAVDNGRIRLLGEDGAEVDADNNPHLWSKLLEVYGTLRPSQSRLTLKTGNDIDSAVGDIIGTIQIDGSDPSVLIWTIDIDTLPANTQTAINGVIEPLRTWPGNGLSPATSGQRYLILDDIGPSAAWPGLNAMANDIIQFTGASWVVAFRPNTVRQVILNTATGRQLRWTGSEWIMAIDGHYSPGYWRINL